MKKIVFSVVSTLLAGSLASMVAAQSPGAPVGKGQIKQVLLSGTVVKEGGAYFLTDDKTQIRSELRGSELGKYLNKTVRIQGRLLPDATPAGGASQIVQVGNILPGGVAAAGAGGKVAAGAVKGGMSKGAIAGVIAGGSAAGTVGGLYASGAIGSDDAAVSRP
ncbi:MAG TPA: hypothetical protein VMZ52_02540 [Bryobacteraceae bacterium]|nr:hypothetical protein [Bryobacteraceae bacterium]